ncbi:hypothetical protein EZV62_017851 [Acer yangbiense]|uniref:Glycosyl hydrolase family 32 N-terminal domain-containing protein n=1 Tax=Acer yangbiense TaxID=1000413 RepID=A0A5C7HI69_9ROSI|nr:hypothetical protein EZV62_017851 [Acer yangbiense]
MDTATTISKSFNVLPSSTTQKKANTTYFIKKAWPSTRPEALSLQASCGRFLCSSFPSHQRASFSDFIISRNSTLFLTHCYTKPGIDSANKSAASIELDPNSSAAQEHDLAATDGPPNNQALTSTCSEGLVLDLGLKTSWDSAEIGSPVVKRYIGDNEERWYMWYHGRSNNGNSTPSDSIGLAVSSNGIHWARGTGDIRSCADSGVVMKCRENWWAFDTQSIRPSEMVLMSSPMYSAVYWLYYTGYTSEQVEINYPPGVPRICIENPERNSMFGKKFYKSLPGLACSQDGRHWARIEGDHHSGALLDVGSEKEWDSLFIAGPQVVVHSSDDLRMYYHSFDVEKGEFAIGMARSRDGIRWVKLGKILGSSCFDEFGVKNACVRKNQREGNYLMAYEGVGKDGKRSIGLAVSPDGVKNWKRIQEDHEAALEASTGEDGWDNEGVGSPCLVRMEDSFDEWRLYYVGVGQGGRTGIGMAVSQGTCLNTFTRLSGFHL